MEKVFKYFPIVEVESAGTGKSYRLEKSKIRLTEDKLSEHINQYNNPIIGREVSTSGLIIYYDEISNKPLFATLLTNNK
jgi:hypothetical protein